MHIVASLDTAPKLLLIAMFRPRRHKAKFNTQIFPN